MFAECPKCGDVDQEIQGSQPCGLVWPEEHTCSECGAVCRVEYDADYNGDHYVGSAVLVEKNDA